MLEEGGRGEEGEALWNLTETQDLLNHCEL